MSPKFYIEFKTSMIRSNLCDYGDAYTHLKRTMEVPNTASIGAPANNINKKITFKNCAPFTNCISKINNKQVDDIQDVDIVMSLYNLIEYKDIFLKTSGSLWQYYRNEPALKIIIISLILLLIIIIAFRSNLSSK